MDATARLLAPKDAPAQPRQQAAPKKPQTPTAPSRKQKQPDSQRKAQQPAPRKEAPSPRKKAAARPAPRQETPKRDQKRRNDRRRGPMEVTLRLGSQKDSTEQSGSLMRPYYLHDDD